MAAAPRERSTQLEDLAAATPVQPVAAPAPRRLVEFDAMRGIAIVFVVYLHAYFSPWEVTPDRQKLAVHVIHLFAHTAVPVFLFASGFFLARERRVSFPEFLRKKALRIGLPLLTWMLVAFAYKAWDHGGIDSELVRNLALFNISGQFYYLFVLAVFYVAFFFVKDAPLPGLAILVAFAFVANLGAILYYEHSTISGDFAILAYRNPLVWVFAFSFGLYVSRRWERLEWTARWLWPGVAAMAAVFAWYLWQGEQGDGYPVSYFGPSVFLFACLSLVVLPAALFRLRQSRAGAFVTAPARALGRYAFAIYLVHMPLFIGYVTMTFVSDSVVQDDYWDLMNGIFFVGFATALASVVVVDLAFPRFAALFLGVEARAKTIDPVGSPSEVRLHPAP